MTFTKTSVLVVAKTYPNLSKKYDKTVCTAGIVLQTKSWIRIFPVRFFDLPFDRRPKKYDIIEIEVEPYTDKFKRKESFKAHDETINKISHIGTESNWEERKKILLPLLNKSIEELNDLREKEHTSLGIIKPKKIIDFQVTPIEKCREWERDLISGVQHTLSGQYKTPLDKIPYRFSYVFECDDPNCKGHDLMIEDWEICQLFRAIRMESDEKTAIDKVREKYFDYFTQKTDIHLILGTESSWNNWLVIGVFYPQKQNQK
jgi:hypothetical protein